MSRTALTPWVGTLFVLLCFVSLPYDQISDGGRVLLVAWLAFVGFWPMYGKGYHR